MYNKVILMGEIYSTPEHGQSSKGHNFSTFILKVPEDYQKDNEWKVREQYINLVAWDSLSNLVKSRLTVGVKVILEGKLKSKRFLDKNGNQQFKTDVQVKLFRIIP